MHLWRALDEVSLRNKGVGRLALRSYRHTAFVDAKLKMCDEAHANF